MAEVLAVLGGAAALTQLIHYGVASISTASALSHSIRHTGDKIDSWLEQSLMMIKLVDDIQQLVLSHTPSIDQFLDQCRKDAMSLRSLLETGRRSAPAKKRSKISDSLFIVLNEKEVERLMSSYRSRFGMLASYFMMVTIGQNTTPSTTSMQTELTVPRANSYHGLHVTKKLEIEFGINFTRAQNLQRGHELHLQVSAVLETTMQHPVDRITFAQTAALAIRFCMYLLTTGHYSRVLDLLATFKKWSRAVLPAYHEALMALRGKEAVAHASHGNSDTALRMFHSLHRSRTKLLGKEDISTVHSLNGLGLMYHAVGDDCRAMHHHKKALQSKSELLGPDDPDTLVSANNLGLVFMGQGEHEAAEVLFKQSLKGWLQAYGADDLFVVAARSNIGINLHLQGKFDEAKHYHRYVYRKRKRILGPHHHETIKSHANLAITLNEQGHHALAETMYRDALSIFHDKLGGSHPDTLKTHTNLATALHDQGKYADAESVIASALPLMRQKFGAVHPETLKALEFRAILLHHTGKLSKALGIARDLYDAREQQLGYDHDDTQKSLRHVRDLAEDVEEANVMRRFPSAFPVAVR